MNLKNILEAFRKKGHRLTKTRKAMVRVFLHNNRPLSAADINSRLEHLAVTVNKTTIYREIDFLKKERFIREIELGDGMKRYELWPDDHHHHLICVECNSVKCIDMEHCLVNEEKKISEKNNFKIMEHSLKFFGLCAKCQ